MWIGKCHADNNADANADPHATFVGGGGVREGHTIMGYLGRLLTHQKLVFFINRHKKDSAYTQSHVNKNVPPKSLYGSY